MQGFKRVTLAVLLALAVQLIGAATVQAYTPVKGDLVRFNNGQTVFLVDDTGQRTPLSNEAFNIRYNGNYGLVKSLSEAEIGGYATNFIINEKLSSANGSLIKYWNDPTIYLVENGMKRGFTTWESFVSRNYSMDQVRFVGDFEIYPSGELIR